MRRYMQNIHIHVSTLIYIVNSVTQWHPEGLVVWTIARQVSANDSEKLFSDPKAQDRKPLIHWQKPKHTGSNLKGYKNIHLSHRGHLQQWNRILPLFRRLVPEPKLCIEEPDYI